METQTQQHASDRTSRVSASHTGLRGCKTTKRRRTRLTATGRLSGEILSRPEVDPAIEALAGNVIDTYGVPVGAVENFTINGRQTMIYMATQERSVVEAASYGAKLCAANGFRVQVGENLVACQVAFMPHNTSDETDGALSRLAAFKRSLLDQLREHDTLRKHGGGIVGLSPDQPRYNGLEIDAIGPERMIVLKLTANAAESMGANAITKLGERLGELAAPIVGTPVLMAVVTNCFQGLPITATASWAFKDIGGKAVAERIVQAQRFAHLCALRAATHNKGVANGIDAVALLCGQDVQAIDASMNASTQSHCAAYAPIKPLTTFKLQAGSLRGELRMRIPLATVGGATSHPQAAFYRKAMGIASVRDLAAVLGAVGLAQNFGALRCLVSEGITAAHDRLKR